ncbi:MAG TPA: poly-beta-1,6-N-acetyl-D-glucosamine N-deacetylase PgaB, partial [Desulfobulbaceae bacterium]|nr:poly-beta-1,6-N-acetyl-D-glucosamine N-deacetylase PgaB [Desulfobulbaceae bacterium]
QRVCSLGLTTVLLQAFADPDGNDGAEALYFPNHALPMRRNLFPQVAETLHRCGLKVYAWMPMLAFTLGRGHENLLVRKIDKSGKIVPTAHHRLSPFNPAARKIIRQIYQDLARSATFDGILFHDDAVLSDYEDASPTALAAYKKAGFPADITRIRSDDTLMEQWSRFKTKALIHFSGSLLAAVRKYHPHIRSGRNLYARPILQPKSEQWFAQSLPLFLQAYDYTFVLAMPCMEKVEDTNSWLATLADRAMAWTVNPSSLVFELQTVDWRRRQKIHTAEIVAQVKLLQRHGIKSFAYYPDDFLRNHPDADRLRQLFAELTPTGVHNSHD